LAIVSDSPALLICYMIYGKLRQKFMPQKILLVSSSFEEVSLINASSYQKTGVKTTEVSHYPLGLAYLHAYLEPHGYEIRTLFLNNHTQEDCFRKTIEKIREFSPDIIGFQIFTANRVSSYALIEYIYKNYPKIKIIIGGIHATLMAEQVIEKFPFAAAVLGEGEETFLALAEELSKEKPNLDNVDGIAFCKNNKAYRTKERKLIENLDDLPFPKHEIFFADKRRTSGCLVTSRGCPFNCSFCCLDSISRRRVRLRSAKNVVDEIEMMVKKFPQMKRIWIQDDNFFIDNQRVIDICDEIIKRKIKTSFVCSARIKPISKEMVVKLEKANFKKVLFGLESGDNGILKRCHKGITQEDAIHALKLFASSKIVVGTFLIVGLPGETLETIMETARFVKKLQKIKYFYLSEVSVLIVYPGTEVYEIAKAGGMIDDNYWLSDKPTPLFTLEHSQEELFKFKDILLNYISLDNFFTPAGFIAQLDMIPQIARYVMGNKRILKGMVSRSMRILLPEKVFETAKRFYHLIGNKFA
jgi:radical SAM superfamily enzyme YgiQ (UPF0313 family)